MMTGGTFTGALVPALGWGAVGAARVVCVVFRAGGVVVLIVIVVVVVAGGSRLIIFVVLIPQVTGHVGWTRRGERVVSACDVMAEARVHGRGGGRR